MVKRVDNAENLKMGDDIALFVVGAGDKARTVTKKFFRVLESPFREGEYLKFRCRKIREDGSYMLDSYGDIQDVTFCLNQNGSKNYVITNLDAYYGHDTFRYYFQPSIPCEKIVKRLIQEKRKLNKYIIDCQNLMYKKNEQEESGI